MNSLSFRCKDCVAHITSLSGILPGESLTLIIEPPAKNVASFLNTSYSCSILKKAYILQQRTVKHNDYFICAELIWSSLRSYSSFCNPIP